MLNIGITTRAYTGKTVAEAAKGMAERGFHCTELCFVLSDLPGWQYNGIGPLDGITPAKVKEAAGIFRENGIEVTSLGLFTDLRGQTEETRKNAVDYAKRYIEFAAEAGVPYIASECGFKPGSRGINADTYESDYQNLKDTLREICTEAGKSGIQFCLECCVIDIIPSPRRLKTLIDELKTESGVTLGAMLDPANFIAAADEEDMFRYLKNDICYMHGKDRKINATYGVNLGDGDIDWTRFMKCYQLCADGKPFILEYCNSENCGEIKKRADLAYEKALLS